MCTLFATDDVELLHQRVVVFEVPIFGDLPVLNRVHVDGRERDGLAFPF